MFCTENSEVIVYFMCSSTFFLIIVLFLQYRLAFMEKILNSLISKCQWHLKVQVYLKNIPRKICLKNLFCCNLAQRKL